jgi:hypothetical protein
MGMAMMVSNGGFIVCCILAFLSILELAWITSEPRQKRGC